MATASRVSISRRCIMNTSLPSRKIATDGDDGGWGHVFPRALGRFHIGTGEDGRDDRRLDAVAQREGDAGAGLAGGASAHRVDDDHRGAVLGHGLVHGAGGAELFHAKAGQFLAHRGHELFGIGQRVVARADLSAARAVGAQPLPRGSVIGTGRLDGRQNFGE
jgi:hypothetical protein